ncbi:unnamed protein product, partial [Ectocarpus fasciculatus]
IGTVDRTTCRPFSGVPKKNPIESILFRRVFLLQLTWYEKSAPSTRGLCGKAWSLRMGTLGTGCTHGLSLRGRGGRVKRRNSVCCQYGMG